MKCKKRLTTVYMRNCLVSRRFGLILSWGLPCEPGLENVSDHGPRKFFGIPENIQDSVTKEENVSNLGRKIEHF